MTPNNKTDILLIYPPLGSFDNIIRDIPLSLIYAATESVKNGYNVEIFDCRLNPNNWKKDLTKYLNMGCSLAGLSVMTGYPISTSLEISKFIKESCDIPIVWGGPHPTVLPEETLRNVYVDFVIRDWGSIPLFQLISHLKDNRFRLDEITGLGYKKDNEVILNKPTSKFEIIDYHDICYHLVDINFKKYNRLQSEELFFPIYTAMGCPCQCAFCIAPAVYKKIQGRKWVPFSVDFVIGHIEYLCKRYRFNRLQVYDDNSFVDLSRMKEFFLKYIERGFHRRLKIDFRGVRIDEVDKMDKEFLKLMVEANVELLELGAESGSDESLKRMRKGITVEQILRVNRRLAEFSSLKPHYNILCGIPGETYEDLKKTKSLMETLVRDNPSCFLGAAADWKPLPGSLMTEIAVSEYNLKLPQKLEEWTRIDTTDAEKIVHPWYTRKMDNYIKLLQIAGLLLDNKIDTIRMFVSSKRFNVIRLFLILAKMYRPFLKLRLKLNCSAFLLEYPMKNLAMKMITRK